MDSNIRRKEFIIKEFVLFLKKNEVYYKYVNNYCKDHSLEPIQFKSFFMKKYLYPHTVIDEERGFLSNAFLWGETNEGHRYWAELDNKWEKYLKNGKNIKNKETC